MKIYCTRISAMTDEEFLISLVGKDLWIKIYDKHAEDYCYINITGYNNIGYRVRSISCEIVHTFSLDNDEDREIILGNQYGLYKKDVVVVHPYDMLTTEELFDVSSTGEKSHVVSP